MNVHYGSTIEAELDVDFVESFFFVCVFFVVGLLLAAVAGILWVSFIPSFVFG